MPLGHKKPSEHPGRIIIHNVGDLSPGPVRQGPKLRVSGGVVTDRALPVFPPEGLEAGIETGKEDEYLREIKVKSTHAYGTTWSGLVAVELTKSSPAASIWTCRL